MTVQPAWMSKHPCTACGTGYGECAQGLSHGLKCCVGCGHPSRWVDEPYTVEEVQEMWAGRDMPPHVARRLASHGTLDTA